MSDSEAAPARRRHLVVADHLYAFGVALLLAGTVLPWMRLDGEPLWGWDFSVFWSLTGRSSTASLPPSAGAFLVAVGLVLAAPVVLSRRIVPALASGLSGAVLGVGVLTLVRTLALESGTNVDAGLTLVLAGAVLVSAGSLLQAA